MKAEIINEIQRKFCCPKCSHNSVVIGGLSATGKGLSRMFDIQHNKFTTVTCGRCGYTEFFKDNITNQLSAEDFLDFFFGG